MTQRIDTHQHFWRVARGDYGWLDPNDASLRPLVRDFEPAHLEPMLARHGIAQTVVVQAAQTEAETDFLLQLADQHAWIGGVVGWVDLSDPNRARTLRRWATNKKLEGVRPMLQDLPDADWIATAPHPSMVEALIEHGLRFDALVKPPHLAALERFVERWPALPVVVDHAAKPVLRDGWDAPWAQVWKTGIERLARHPQVCCKFSALLTECAPQQIGSVEAAVRTVRPVWDFVLEHFGAQRVMWGSDWPVLTLAGGYDVWFDVSRSLIDTLPAADQAHVWSGTARRFYALAP